MSSNKLLDMAKIAEQAERYEDMAKFIKQYTEEESYKLQRDQRNVLSVAYKNVIGSRRTAWRVLSSMESKGGSEQKEELIKEYKKQVHKEVKDTCDEVIGLLKQIIDNVDESDIESNVFYLKMVADYYRYLGEVASGNDEKTSSVESANEFYDKAFNKAKDLPSTHPIRLGLALNFSVFYYEIMGKSDKACELAKEAFDNGISELDQLQEESYKDSTLIMQLLRDNLTLWTTDQGNEDGDEPEESSQMQS